jgi:hypothetical protein
MPNPGGITAAMLAADAELRKGGQPGVFFPTPAELAQKEAEKAAAKAARAAEKAALKAARTEASTAADDSAGRAGFAGLFDRLKQFFGMAAEEDDGAGLDV